MEVTHVLVAIMPSGRRLYGILGYGCNWVGFSKQINRFLGLGKFNKLEGVRGSKKVEKKVLGMGFAWWAKCLYTSWEYF